MTVRVANILPFIVLKSFAFQDRHENKDAYDLIFTLLHFSRGPHDAGAAAVRSPVAGHRQVVEALSLLKERFQDVEQDGPVAYAVFLAASGDKNNLARLRREAVATVSQFLRAYEAR